MNKEKAVQRIEYHTTKMFPDKRDAPTQETYIKEMSEGIRELGGAVDDDSEGDDEQVSQRGSKPCRDIQRFFL